MAENGNGNNSITFPGWFLKTVGAVSILFMGVFMPWATYMTVMLFNVSYKVERNTAIELKADEARSLANENKLKLAEHERRINTIETRENK